MISTSIETITPELAADALKANSRNRPLSRKTVRIYAAAIGRGEWQLNGEPIIFDAAGMLNDGQHRLHAVMLAKRPIESLVVRGVAGESFATLNGGKKRNAADVLGMAGYKYVTITSVAARAIIRIENGQNARSFATSAQIMTTVQAHPQVSVWAARYAGSKMKTFMTAQIIGVLTLAAERFGAETVGKFFDNVSEGVNLSATDPCHLLRERFITGAVNGKGDMPLAICIKAMNAYLSGSQQKWIRYSATEAFPELKFNDNNG